MKPWPKVALGDLISRADETAVLDPLEQYHEVTIKLWGKGVLSRGKVLGSDVVSVRRVVRANQLIMSKIDARNGAIGLVPPELDCAIVSNDFPSFSFNDLEQCDPAFMGWLVRSTPFVDLCKAASEGTTNRVRIKEDRFLSQQIALPPLSDQQRIVARLDALAEKTRRLEAHLDAVERDSLRLLVTMATRCDLSGDQRLGLGWREVALASIARIALDPVTVNPTQTYPNIGIYSYARGLFEKPPIDGIATSAKTLYRIKAGQFIYSRLFAFEGAYALVGSSFDGSYVSNEFPTFDVDSEIATAKFVMSLFLTEQDWHGLRAASKGVGDRRMRIQPQDILARKIWLPPPEEMARIDRLYDGHFALKAKHTAIRAANTALLPATLERVFQSGVASHV